MKCSNCGYINDNDALFCANCGKELLKDKKNKKTSKKKMSLKKILPISIIFLFVFVTIFLLAMKSINEKRYEDKIETAQKYREELKYKQAETYYLDAIDIDPKKADAYVGLADIYIDQSKTMDAENILIQAQKDVEKEDKQVIDDKKEEIDKKVVNIKKYQEIIEGFKNDDIALLESAIYSLDDTTICNFFTDDKLNKIIYIPDGSHSGKGLGIYVDDENAYLDVKDNLYFYYGEFDENRRDGNFKVFNMSNKNDVSYIDININYDEINGDIIRNVYNIVDLKLQFIFYEFYDNGYLDGDFSVDIYKDEKYCCTAYGHATNGVYQEITDSDATGILNEDEVAFIYAFAQNDDHDHIVFSETSETGNVGIRYLP